MTPQADWVKEFDRLLEPIFVIGAGYYQCLSGVDNTKEIEKLKDYIQSQITLAQQRTEKKWRESPPEIKTELPFSVTINGVPHILTSISEQNFASLLRFGGEIDGKIILTFTRSDLLK